MLSGCKKSFPEIDTDTLEVSAIPEENKETPPEEKIQTKKEKKEVIRKEKKDESHDYNESKENGSDDEKIDTQIDANVSKDMFNNSDEDMHCEDVDEDDVQKTVKLKNDKSKQQMNSVDIQINGGKEGEESDVNSEDENAKARAAVLQTTSSECNKTININGNVDDCSPRKKLKTKKERDQIRKSISIDTSKGQSNHNKQDKTYNRARRNSDSLSGSGEELMGISSGDDDDPVKLKKKSKKAVTKRKNGYDSEVQSIPSDSGGDSKVHKHESTNKDSKHQNRTFKKLNILAASVDIKRNDQLHKSIQIDIQNLNADIKFDLEEYGEVTL